MGDSFDIDGKYEDFQIYLVVTKKYDLFIDALVSFMFFTIFDVFC